MTGLPPGRLLRGLALAGLLIAWAWLAHYTSAGEGDPDLAVALASAPILAVVLLLLGRSGRRWWMLVGTLASLGGLIWYWPELRRNVALLYFLQHLGTNLALAVLFGRSLFGPGEALVTQFARLAHQGVLSTAQARYTRQVTRAWTLFFVLMALVSTGLFLLAPPILWSVFANLLTMPLLCLMFLGEWLVRNLVLPPADRTGITDSLRAYRASLNHKRPLANQE